MDITRHHVASAFKRLILMAGFLAHRNNKDMRTLVRMAHSQLASNGVTPREVAKVLQLWPAHQPYRHQANMVYASMLWEMVSSVRAAGRKMPTKHQEVVAIHSEPQPSTINFFYQEFLASGPDMLPGLTWLTDGLSLDWCQYMEAAQQEVIRDNAEHKRMWTDRGQQARDLDNLENRITGRAKRLAALAYFENLKSNKVVKVY